MKIDSPTNFSSQANAYLALLSKSFDQEILEKVEMLAFDLHKAWCSNKQVFICGNGGSAANAQHLSAELVV